MQQTESASDPAQVNTGRRLYRWDAPDGDCSIALDSNVVEGLRRRALQAYVLVPKRGAEIGGLLFGQVRQGGSLTFQIDTCEEIPCEYRFGPSYRLSEADHRHLSERLAQIQQGGHRQVIGFYRSYTGRDAVLDQADQELVSNLFPHSHPLLFLLQPTSPERCVARFQIGSEGELAGEAYEPFQLEPSQLKEATMTEPEVSEVAEAAAPPEPFCAQAVESPKAAMAPLSLPAARRSRLQEDEAPARRGSRPWTLLWLCALAAIAGAAGYEIWTLEHQPRWVPLGLNAAVSARDLQLSWDSAAPAIQQASLGMMNVTDGPVQYQIPLTAAQLRSGKFAYKLSHDNALFRLLVYDPTKRVAGDSLYVARLHLDESTPASKPVTAQPTIAAAVPAEDTSEVGTPAVARHEVQPAVPAGIRARVHSRIVVPVQLHINAAGQVTDAASRIAGPGLNRYLADQAVKAARQWSFVPARSKSGHAVTSSKSVQFVFEPAP